MKSILEIQWYPTVEVGKTKEEDGIFCTDFTFGYDDKNYGIIRVCSKTPKIWKTITLDRIKEEDGEIITEIEWLNRKYPYGIFVDFQTGYDRIYIITNIGEISMMANVKYDDEETPQLNVNVKSFRKLIGRKIKDYESHGSIGIITFDQDISFVIRAESSVYSGGTWITTNDNID